MGIFSWYVGERAWVVMARSNMSVLGYVVAFKAHSIEGVKARVVNPELGYDAYVSLYELRAYNGPSPQTGIERMP